MYNPYEIGNLIYLRHPKQEDVDGKWHEWLSDPEITKYLIDRYWPNSKESQQAFYDTSIMSQNRLLLSVITKEDNKHIGIVSLSGINWVQQYADIAVLIGDKEFQNGKYSTEVFALILKVAFLRLNLSNIKSAYCSGNKGSEALHRIFKFKHVGKYPDLVSIEGEFQDLILEVLNKESWLKRNKG